MLPLDQPGDLFDPGSVLIEGKDIVAVGTIDDLDRRAEGATVIDASGQAVIPGLHNSHLHSGLLRGTAESMSLWDWAGVGCCSGRCCREFDVTFDMVAGKC